MGRIATVDFSWADSESVLLVEDPVSAESWRLIVVIGIFFAVSWPGKRAMPSFKRIFSPCRLSAVAAFEGEAMLTWKPVSIGSLLVTYVCTHTLMPLD